MDRFYFFPVSRSSKKKTEMKKAYILLMLLSLCAYENAVNFAQNITLPATAKTYCICDHNWKCIKSGTGDEEQKYTLHSKKVKFSKNERIIPQIMSPSGMKLYKERQDSSRKQI